MLASCTNALNDWFIIGYLSRRAKSVNELVTGPPGMGCALGSEADLQAFITDVYLHTLAPTFGLDVIQSECSHVRVPQVHFPPRKKLQDVSSFALLQRSSPSPGFSPPIHPRASDKMKPSPRISLLALRDCLSRPSVSALPRQIHTNPSPRADVVPVYGTGPPPEPPTPTTGASDPRVTRRKRQAEMLKRAKDLRTAANKSSSSSRHSSPLKRRFWEHVHVVESGEGYLQICLDTRPIRHPTTKQPIRLPASKPHLAAAIALEWDLLTSAQQATKQHLIPLTSLACRAIDIGADDASSSDGIGAIRRGVVDGLMRYLDTDSLLCLAPPPDPNNPILQTSTRSDAGETLREVQERAAVETIAWLTSHVWPGIEIQPVLDGDSIVPKSQKPGVREVVQGWVTGLDHWELAGLERAVLASKSMLTAARLVAEWSEGDAGVGMKVGSDKKFGVEEAAQAASLEVEWQISRWGEVEDTHDVEKEDLRRQLGSAVLLVSGTGGR